MQKVTLLSLITFLLAGCEEPRLSAKQQAALVADAKRLEAEGHFAMAYREYSHVLDAAGPHTEDRRYAGDKAFKMSTLISQACEPVVAGVKDYVAKHHKPPESLEIFRGLVPQTAIVAFEEFRLVTLIDGSTGVDCGSYGPINKSVIENN